MFSLSRQLASKWLFNKPTTETTQSFGPNVVKHAHFTSLQNTALSAGPETTTAPEASKQSFSWTKQWYPVALTKDLDTYKPNAIKLLGKDLVLWKDGDSEWRCFDDVCPHRSRPQICIACFPLMLLLHRCPQNVSYGMLIPYQVRQSSPMTSHRHHPHCFEYCLSLLSG